MTDTNADLACIVCGCDDKAAPLLQIRTHGALRHICSQHLPILIHDPARLAGKLPGAEGLEPAPGD